MTFNLNTIGEGLKAASLVPELNRAADSGPLRTIVVSPPGTGKTTVIPPAVANLINAGDSQNPGRVIVTQPRRMAARAAARRLAQLSGTQLGDLAGFTVRGESKLSRNTRVEFVTNGVLLRRLMSDPDLPGVSAVIIDEIHERQLDGDLVAGMVDQIAQLREDLHLVLMSATLAAQQWSKLYDAEVLEVEDVLYPLEEIWAPAPVRAIGTRGVEFTFLDHVAEETRRAAATTDGDVLVFLPGAREIDRVASQVPGSLKLLGSTPSKEQDAILQPADHQRIILATNVAESALTVPGVDTVVDAGLDRQLRLDSGRNMTGLVTVGAAKASMVQRAGRAARLGPGRVVRCMDSAEFAARPDAAPAEVLTSDLTQAVLDLAVWGTPGGQGLRLPDPLPRTGYNAALEQLTWLGAVEGTAGEERPTSLGSQLATIPTDPRLARALIDGAELIGGRAAAEAVATLNSDHRETNLTALLSRLRSSKDSVWRDDIRRLLRHVVDDSSRVNEHGLGIVTALAFPDRIGKSRGDEYLLSSGTAVQLPPGSGLTNSEWLAVAEVSVAGSRALVRKAIVIDRSVAELVIPETTSVQASYDKGKATVRKVTSLGAIVLASTPVPATGPKADADTRQAVAQAVADAVAAEGWDVLAPSENFFRLLDRLTFLHHRAPGWPNVAELESNLAEWAGTELDAVASGRRADLVSALKTWIGWDKVPELERLAPETLPIPSGRDARLSYENDEVILAVKLQEMFGATQTPRVADHPVTLHLLSPAQRPLAITQDLANFWAHVYPEVRAENRGRYSKHPWPENPLTATPTAKTSTMKRGKR